MNYQVFIFDFGGVLSTDRFYTNLIPQHHIIYQWIQTNIFGNKDLVKQWMRGERDSDYINTIISHNFNIEFDFFKKLFIESVALMSIDERIKELIVKLKNLHKKVALVTDNMDVFRDITIDNHELDKLFDVIITSIDYGFLKPEQEGKLFDIALEKLKEHSFEHTLLIDDSADTVELYRKKGGSAYLYKNFDDFNNWLQKVTS